MRYEPDHKQHTRERVLKAAAKAIRAEGPRKVGVAAVMARAGLTVGGFYAHFESKDDFLSAAVGHALEEAHEKLDGDLVGRSAAEGLEAYVDFYLSPAHRDARTSGCPLPFLSADAPRMARAARLKYAEGVAGLTGRLAKLLLAMGRPAPEPLAVSVLSEMVGAVALARAEPDRDRSDAILAASMASVKQRLGLEAAR